MPPVLVIMSLYEPNSRGILVHYLNTPYQESAEFQTNEWGTVFVGSISQAREFLKRELKNRIKGEVSNGVHQEVTDEKLSLYLYREILKLTEISSKSHITQEVNRLLSLVKSYSTKPSGYAYDLLEACGYKTNRVQTAF